MEINALGKKGTAKGKKVTGGEEWGKKTRKKTVANEEWSEKEKKTERKQRIKWKGKNTKKH